MPEPKPTNWADVAAKVVDVLNENSILVYCVIIAVIAAWAGL